MNNKITVQRYAELVGLTKNVMATVDRLPGETDQEAYRRAVALLDTVELCNDETCPWGTNIQINVDRYGNIYNRPVIEKKKCIDCDKRAEALNSSYKQIGLRSPPHTVTAEQVERRYYDIEGTCVCVKTYPVGFNVEPVVVGSTEKAVRSYWITQDGHVTECVLAPVKE